MTSDKSYTTEQRLNALMARVGLTDAGGYPELVDAQGLTLNSSGWQLAQTGGVGPITNTALTSLGFVNVPATDPENGSIWAAFAEGVFSTGGSAPASATFTVTAGGITAATLAVPTLSTGLTSAPWFARTRLTWTGATTADVILEVGWRTAAGVAGSAYWFVQASPTGLDQTAIRQFGIKFQWGTAPAGTSLTSNTFAPGRLA